MSEEDGIVSSSVGAGADALGMAMKADPPAEEARAYLREQTELARRQTQNLIEQNAFELSHLRWRRFSDQMRGVGQILLVMLAAAVIFVIGAAVWAAAHDRALVVESFSVPADLAQNGQTGTVIATHLLDRIAAMQAATPTTRAADSYRNDWGDDFKVQIPETGISMGEAYRLLRGWLGSETHITGEVVHSDKGYAVTARAGAGAAQTFEDPSLDPLLQQAAEHVFAVTQSYRYAMWLNYTGRDAEGRAVLENIAGSTAPADERAWAYGALISIAFARGDFAGAEEDANRAIALKPDLVVAFGNRASLDSYLSQDERALHDGESTLRLAEGSSGAELSPSARKALPLGIASSIAALRGDFRTAAELRELAANSQDAAVRRGWSSIALAEELAQSHDSEAARAALLRTKLVRIARIGYAELDALDMASAKGGIAVATQDWRSAAKAFAEGLKGVGARRYLARRIIAELARARAELGDFAAAHALIDQTPGDCYICLRMRGNIDAVRGNWGAAAYWFARAAAAAPSIPFAYADWGAMLLRKGEYDGAIGKFSVANAKGPHFADPLEMWGEALMLKNRSDLALAKFMEANNYAPNWGRLHLRWGEALIYAGRKDEARKQLQIAFTLDLSAADRARLAGVAAMQ